MARRQRIRRPPSTGEPNLDRWLREISTAINEIPSFSLISTTDGPESAVSASSGEIAFDVGSSATTWWGKTSGSGNTGWEEFTLGSSNNPQYGDLWFDGTVGGTDGQAVNSGGAVYTPWEEAAGSSDLSSSLTEGIHEVQSDGGTYHFAFSSNFSVSGINTQLIFELQKNGASIPTTKVLSALERAASNRESFAGFSSVQTADSDDSFTIWVETGSNSTNTITTDAAHFTVSRLR